MPLLSCVFLWTTNSKLSSCLMHHLCTYYALIHFLYSLPHNNLSLLCVLCDLLWLKILRVFGASWWAIFRTKRAAIYNQIPKKIKIFYNFLTLYPSTTYLFSVFSVFSVANVFFVPNAQLRPIVERRRFSAPVARASRPWKHGRVLFWTFIRRTCAELVEAGGFRF